MILSAGYVTMTFAFPPPTGGFGSFTEVTELFAHADTLIAGWIHYLAFDLLVGAWICRQGRRDDMAFWLVAPCLPVIFLFGPAGYLMFQIVRCVRRAAVGFVRDL